MHRLLGRYLRFLHDAHNHSFIEVRIATWINFALLLLAALALLGGLPGGRMTGYFLVGIILILLISNRIARRRYYVHFVSRPLSQPSQPDSPLWPDDKVLHRATGYFLAEGQEASLTDLPAYYRTFETREHVIMARKTLTHFHGIGLPDPDLLHMWYMFMPPAQLQKVLPGDLYFGAESRPAIKIAYTRFEQKGAKRKAVAATAYLSFEAEADCRRVYADLLLDLGGPPRSPWRRSFNDVA